MSIIKIAYRNVERQKRRSNLLVGAIAFGIFIILLLNSLTSGLVANAQNNFTSLLGGHIYIGGQEVLESGRVVNRTDDTHILDQVLPGFENEIEGVFKRSSSRGEFIFGSNSTTISLSGVDWKSEGELIGAFEVIEGSLEALNDPSSLVLPDSTAIKLGVITGETVLFRFDTVTGQKNVGEFTVGAIIKDTGSFGISSAYGNIEYLNPLLGLESDEYQSLNLKLKDINKMDELAILLEEKIEEMAPLKRSDESEEGNSPRAMMFQTTGTTDEVWEGTRFSVATLNDYMDMITQLVGILNSIAIGLFLVILTITMVGLLNTFRMILIERTREIGTMRAVGMLKSDIKKIFLLEALFLALKGALIGIIAALIFGWGISLINFGTDSNLMIFLNNGALSMPFVPSQILGVSLLLSLVTLLAAWLPAQSAAKLQPADALRSNA